MLRYATVMALPVNKQPAFDFTVETAEVKKKGQGILFYILPPLVVAAVFVYCYMNSQVPEASNHAAAKQVKTKPKYSTTAQYVEDDETEDDDSSDSNE